MNLTDIDRIFAQGTPLWVDGLMRAVHFAIIYNRFDWILLKNTKSDFYAILETERIDFYADFLRRCYAQK